MPEQDITTDGLEPEVSKAESALEADPVAEERASFKAELSRKNRENQSLRKRLSEAEAAQAREIAAKQEEQGKFKELYEESLLKMKALETSYDQYKNKVGQFISRTEAERRLTAGGIPGDLVGDLASVLKLDGLEVDHETFSVSGDFDSVVAPTIEKWSKHLASPTPAEPEPAPKAEFSGATKIEERVSGSAAKEVVSLDNTGARLAARLKEQFPVP